MTKIVPALLLAGTLTALSPALPSAPAWAAAPAAQAAGGQDAQIQSHLGRLLKDKRYRSVTASVSGGVVTLTGSVSSFQDKEDAEKRVRKAPNVSDIQNRITIDGPEVSDQVLGQKLAQKIAYDRVGYGTTTFNAVTVSVQNGVVRLGGMVVLPADKDSAHALVASYPGVKGLIDDIQVAPPSPNDDRIRRAVADAIYRYPIFTKYAINPVKPIRIVVLNGNVTLVGSVDNQGDKEAAYIRANGVSGVFKVTNDLQVAGQTER